MQEPVRAKHKMEKSGKNWRRLGDDKLYKILFPNLKTQGEKMSQVLYVIDGIKAGDHLERFKENRTLKSDEHSNTHSNLLKNRRIKYYYFLHAAQELYKYKLQVIMIYKWFLRDKGTWSFWLKIKFSPCMHSHIIQE